jgi:hypothetical protein
MELPKKLIDSVVEKNTQEGNVIMYFSYDLNVILKDKIIVNKEKRLVIVSKSDCGTYYGCIYINSDNYPDISDERILKSQQLVARALKYSDFLDKDSFFDCSALTIKDIFEVKPLIEKEPGRVLGKIDDEDLSAIRNTLKNSTTIPSNQKKLFSLI